MCICVFTGCQDEAQLYLMSFQPFIIRMGSNFSLESFFISLSAPDLHSAQETKTGSNVWKEVPATSSLGPPNHHTCEFIHMSSFLKTRHGAAVSMVHIPVCPSHPFSCPSVSMVFFIDFAWQHFNFLNWKLFQFRNWSEEKEYLGASAFVKRIWCGSSSYYHILMCHLKSLCWNRDNSNFLQAVWVELRILHEAFKNSKVKNAKLIVKHTMVTNNYQILNS